MLKKYFSINITSGTLCQGDKGDALTYVLTLDYDLIVRLDADAISNYFTVAFNRTENVCRFIVEEKDSIRESNRVGEDQFTFDINLYLDDGVTLIDTIVCIINYIYKSTNTGD